MLERKFVNCQLDLIFPLDSHLFAVIRNLPWVSLIYSTWQEKRGLGLYLLTSQSGFSFSKSAINSVCQNSILICYLPVKYVLLS